MALGAGMAGEPALAAVTAGAPAATFSAGMPATGSSAPQTMPGPAYHELVEAGQKDLADRIRDRLELRSDPEADEVEDLIHRWWIREGGPETGYEWLTATRLWLRAGRAAEAELALHEAEDSGGLPPALLLLDQARVAFLAHRTDLGAKAYWKGCEEAADAASIEYWLDIEVLATPEERAVWDRFRTLPATQRDLCGFLRRFWNERAAASGSEVDARVAKHYARLRYALDHYRRRSGKKPPTFSTRAGRPRESVYDDRGLLYIRMGEPDRRTRYAGNPKLHVGDPSPGTRVVSAECYHPNESWAYDYPSGTRVYHFTTFQGTDDWWLIDNLGEVYHCGSPDFSSSSFAAGSLTPLNQARAAIVDDAAWLVYRDLYASRAGLDPAYARLASRMRYEAPDGALGFSTSGLRTLEVQRALQREREWTWADAAFVIDSIPERPEVDGSVRVRSEELQFAGSGSRTRVWLNALVEAEGLTPDTTPDGLLRYRVRAVWAVLRQGEFAGGAGDYHRVSSEFESVSDPEAASDGGIPVRLAADLAPGAYEATLVVMDSRAPPAEPTPGNYIRDGLQVSDFRGQSPLLSDIVVAADSGGSWSPGPGVHLKPRPLHATGPDGVAYIYYEAYHLTPAAEFLTRVQVEPLAGDGQSFELLYRDAAPGARADPAAGADSGAPARASQRVDLSDASPGRYRMTVTVTDVATGRTTLPYRTELFVTRRAR